MKEQFKNVNVLLNNIKDLFKCVMCSVVKCEDLIVFYWGCDHIFCFDCIEKDRPCIICTATDGSETGKQVKLTENENILTIFRSVCNFEDSMQAVNKSESKDGRVYKIQGNKGSKKQMKFDVKENELVSEECKSNDKTESQKRTKKTLNVNKRNHKGETPLHLACRKSNFSLLQELIDAGANPNIQDNAGWTPLHDATVFGRTQVIQFLLDNGARVNTPGHENTTALHQSVVEGNSEITQLLLKYGADKNARNIYGETPLDLIKKFNMKDMEEIMLNTQAEFKFQTGVQLSPNTKNDVILHGLNLNEKETALFATFNNQFKPKTVDKLSSHHPPSHLIVTEDEPKVTWNIVTAVLLACQVVSIKWMKDSIKMKSIQPIEKYKVTKDFYAGFLKSRENEMNQLPGLFSGCHFYFGGNSEFYKTKNCSFLKIELKVLVEKNGGVILSRNPDPESLALEKTIPYHADINSSLAKTSYYIIYSKESWNPVPKYNMPHMKTLPVEWLLASIFNFELIDPNGDQTYTEGI